MVRMSCSFLLEGDAPPGHLVKLFGLPLSLFLPPCRVCRRPRTFHAPFWEKGVSHGVRRLVFVFVVVVVHVHV